MALFLVQHGKNLPKDVDPDKSLSPEGASDVERISKIAKEHMVHVSVIKHSGKTRARQTAEILASCLAPEDGVSHVSGMGPLDDVPAFAETIDSRENLILVGHLPFMEKLTSFLVTGSMDKTVIRFQNGGIVCLDKDPNDGNWVIKWALMPHIE